MLTTGFRSVLGIKVFGPDLGGIQKLGVQIEKALERLPDTRSAFAERTVGGYFLDFNVNREAAARYGLTVGDVNDIIETAIGGKNITTTVEGRERYPVNTRYARDFREDLDALKRVLVPTPTGRAGPNLDCWPTSITKPAPPSVRSENGKLVGFVFVDITTSDIDGYVRKRVAEARPAHSIPPGYYIAMGRPIPVSPGRRRATENRHSVHAADHFRSASTSTRVRSRKRRSCCWPCHSR